MHDDYREIITKAVCGTGKDERVVCHEIKPDHQPTNILGCWVINHYYEAKQASENVVLVEGTYDVHIWYAYNDNEKTAVVCEEVVYEEEIDLTLRDENCLHEMYDIFAKSTKQPNCMQCKIDQDSGKIKAEVIKGFEVKVIGETKITVKVEATSKQLQSANHITKVEKNKA